MYSKKKKKFTSGQIGQHIFNNDKHGYTFLIFVITYIL